MEKYVGPPRQAITREEFIQKLQKQQQPNPMEIKEVLDDEVLDDVLDEDSIDEDSIDEGDWKW